MYVPTAPGSLMRATMIEGTGLFRLARRDAELYSVLVVSCGAWGRIDITDGTGRRIWMQPSTFTGSFVLGAFAWGGLVVNVATSCAPQLQVNWREQDARLV